MYELTTNKFLNQPSNTTSNVMLSNGLPGVFAKTNVL